MGRHYAEAAGAKPEIARAIELHYKPKGQSDTVPKVEEGNAVAVAVALADRLDTLVGFWAIGEKPTGSGDPYQLRRAALSVIRIVLENDLRLPLVRAVIPAIAKTMVSYHSRRGEAQEKATVALRRTGVDPHAIATLLEQTRKSDDQKFDERGVEYAHAIIDDLLSFFA